MESDKIADLRNTIKHEYGFDESAYFFTWVSNNKVINIYNNHQLVRDLVYNKELGGVILLFEIPKVLNPLLLPLEQTRKDDSNYGIDQSWMKMCINVYKDNKLLNLPRFLWVNKSWTLKELHMNYF